MQYQDGDHCKVACFRYAPIGWQKLAHLPGGIPVALRSSPINFALLPWFLLAMLLACWRLSREADVIHANWSINGVLAGLVASARDLPLVTTVRGEDVERAGHSRIFRWLLKRCLIRSDRVVAVSEDFARRIGSAFPAFSHKVSVIPNGVSSCLFARPIQARDVEVLRLVSIGSLIPRKDLATLIRALAGMPRGTAVLDVVGDGGEMQYLKRLANELGVLNSIRFSGAVDAERVPQFLENADVLVLCSRSEGRPNVVLEAMAAGVVVVATAIPGVKELIQDGRNGLLFEVGADSALAGCLNTLHADASLRLRLSVAARDCIRERGLYWEATSAKYAATYAELVAGHAA